MSKPSVPTSNSPAQPLWKGFVQGAVGAMVGASASHPLDLIKVRMQIQGEGAAVAASEKVRGVQSH